MKKLIVLLAAACAVPSFAQTAPSPAPQKSEFVTLGTGGGPVIRRNRAEPANALVVGNSIYLLDTGAGIERQMVGAKLPMAKVRAIFISHHHIDHNADLGQLLASRWMFNHLTPMPVVGPPGTEEMVRGLLAAARPVELAPIGATGPNGRSPLADSVKARDLAPAMDTPTEIYKDENIRVLAVTNTHYHYDPASPAGKFARSYSFRIEAPDRSYVYTGDTGPSRNVTALAKGADVLVSEVIDLDKVTRILKRMPDVPAPMLPNMIKHMEEDHLTPEEIGKMAAAAGVKQVILTHVVPGMDDETDTAGYTNGIQPAFQGPVSVARDLDRF